MALSTCTFDHHLTWRANPIVNADPRSIDSTAQAVHCPQTTGTNGHSEIYGELCFSSNVWTLQPPPWTFTHGCHHPTDFLYCPSPYPLPDLRPELIIRIIVASAEFHHKRRWIAIKYGWGQIISYRCCIISFSTQNVSIGFDQRCLWCYELELVFYTNPKPPNPFWDGFIEWVWVWPKFQALDFKSRAVERKWINLPKYHKLETVELSQLSREENCWSVSHWHSHCTCHDTGSSIIHQFEIFLDNIKTTCHLSAEITSRPLVSR